MEKGFYFKLQVMVWDLGYTDNTETLSCMTE
jgi:hypothetical protein